MSPELFAMSDYSCHTKVQPDQTYLFTSFIPMKQRSISSGLIIVSLLLMAGCQAPIVPNTPEQTPVETPSTPTTPTTTTGSDVKFANITPTSTATFTKGHEDEIAKLYAPKNDPQKTWKDQLESRFKWYDVGEIQAAPYQGWRLVVLDLQCDDMCFSNSIYRFAWDATNQKLVLLKNHSISDEENIFAPVLSKTDPTTVLTSLEVPDTIVMPDGKSVIEKVSEDQWYLPEGITKVAFTDPKAGPVYFANRGDTGCLYVKKGDGSVVSYTYNFNFIANINWNDAKKTPTPTSDYAPNAGGCGISGRCYIVDEVDKKDLTLIAKTSSGQEVYEVKNPVENISNTAVGQQNASLAQLQFDQSWQTYKQSWQYLPKETRKPLMTYAQFKNLHPILYWQDPLGRFSSIVQNQVKPMAECGKPVIYLYPTVATDVHVQVDIDEFTKTIPDYGNNGWTVRAEPNGQLYNYADRTTYPYLFWEGKKKNGISVDQGFVVERKNLKKFLSESLDKMGLNTQEKADFTDFWYERMMKNTQPYFFISFLGTQDFNKVAPLTIEPKPDTLIRVFMYYHPMFTSISVRPQTLKSIPRNGFTVLEWGGTSSMPWQY